MVIEPLFTKCKRFLALVFSLLILGGTFTGGLPPQNAASTPPFDPTKLNSPVKYKHHYSLTPINP